MGKKKENIAIILFGGSGERFSTNLPKQFVDLNGKPLLYYATKALEDSPLVDEILVVGKKGYIDETKKALNDQGFRKIKDVIEGGESRMESVFQGLLYLEGKLDDSSLVLIQDGDRPNLSERLIKENFEAARNHKGAVTAIPSNDSAFIASEGNVDRYLKRSGLYLAQTPQTFVYKPILEAYKKAMAVKDRSIYTDDASIFLV